MLGEANYGAYQQQQQAVALAQDLFPSHSPQNHCNDSQAAIATIASIKKSHD